uniref:Uncharacterized protein n=1 Tax=Rhizophora mucronata TaxID=61149 RepID=A0A2P2PBD9_RHIMU
MAHPETPLGSHLLRGCSCSLPLGGDQLANLLR